MGERGSYTPTEQQTTAREIIDGALKEAAEAMVSIMRTPSRNAMARMVAARDILDRGGLSVKNQDLNFTVPLSSGSAITLNIIGVPAIPQSKPEDA